MLFSKVLIALSVATSAAAYAVPAGAVDGTYVAFMVDGKEVHLTVEDYVKQYPEAEKSLFDTTSPVLAGISPASDGNPLMKREQFIYCGCGYNMVDFETDRAVQGLKDQYLSGISVPPYMSIYTTRGPVVAFSCSRSSTRMHFGQQFLTEAFAVITYRCGRYIAGSHRHSVWPYGDFITGYMRFYGNGQNFCGDSTRSTRENC